MGTIAISEAEYNQMKEQIAHLQQCLSLLQDADFMAKLHTFIRLYAGQTTASIAYLPVSQSVKKDAKEAGGFGMWANRDIDARSLRQQAWGVYMNRN